MQYLEPRDGEAGSSAQQEQDSIVRGSGAAKNSLLSELEQVVNTEKAFLQVFDFALRLDSLPLKGLS